MTQDNDEPKTIRQRIRKWGTFLILFIATIASMHFGGDALYDVSTAEPEVLARIEEQAAVEQSKRVAEIKNYYTVVQQNGQTYYLYGTGEWTTKRPSFLDENNEPILSASEQLEARERAEKMVVETLHVGAMPAWMGFDNTSVMHGEKQFRNTVFILMIWCGIGFSSILYILFFKRYLIGDNDDEGMFFILGLVIFGIAPIIGLFFLPFSYAGVYGTSMLSMLFLWVLTRPASKKRRSSNLASV